MNGYKIRLELRTDLQNKLGQCPISVIITSGKYRKKIATGKKIIPELWNKKKERILDVSDASLHLFASKYSKNTIPVKAELIQIQKDIDFIYNTLKTEIVKHQINTPNLTFGDIITKIQITKSSNKEVHNIENLVEFIEKYIEENRPKRVTGSLKVYNTLKNYLIRYQRTVGRTIKVKDIDYIFFSNFQNFLATAPAITSTEVTPKRLNNVTINKHLKTLKTILNYCKLEGVYSNENVTRFKVKNDPLEVVALTKQELNAIINLDLSNNKSLDKARDAFIMMCVTSLRYSDLAQLAWEHIFEDYIEMVSQKTKDHLYIPRTSLINDLLEKYKAFYRPCPIMSNQQLNKKIKEICKLAEITSIIEIVRFYGNERKAILIPKYQKVSCHTGRKTYITLSLAMGIRPEVVMSVSAHKDYKSFSRYVHIDRNNKQLEINKLWNTAF